jgi:hypothetical protein
MSLKIKIWLSCKKTLVLRILCILGIKISSPIMAQSFQTMVLDISILLLILSLKYIFPLVLRKAKINTFAANKIKTVKSYYCTAIVYTFLRLLVQNAIFINILRIPWHHLCPNSSLSVVMHGQKWHKSNMQRCLQHQ